MEMEPDAPPADAPVRMSMPPVVPELEPEPVLSCTLPTEPALLVAEAVYAMMSPLCTLPPPETTYTLPPVMLEPLVEPVDRMMLPP